MVGLGQDVVFVSFSGPRGHLLLRRHVRRDIIWWKPPWPRRGMKVALSATKRGWNPQKGRVVCSILTKELKVKHSPFRSSSVTYIFQEVAVTMWPCFCCQTIAGQEAGQCIFRIFLVATWCAKMSIVRNRSSPNQPNMFVFLVDKQSNIDELQWITVLYSACFFW